MTTVSGSSGTNYNQLLGVKSNDSSSNFNENILKPIANAAGIKADDSSSSTDGNLGLSQAVLDLLQGTTGADYMNELLADGTSSPLKALLGGQEASNIVATAVKAAQAKKNAIDPNTGGVSALVNSYNDSVNAAYKASQTAATDDSTATSTTA